MIDARIYDAWAPRNGSWSPCVKPVLFAHMGGIILTPLPQIAPETIDVMSVPAADGSMAVVVDLPGAEHESDCHG